MNASVIEHSSWHISAQPEQSLLMIIMMRSVDEDGVLLAHLPEERRRDMLRELFVR